MYRINLDVHQFYHVTADVATWYTGLLNVKALEVVWKSYEVGDFSTHTLIFGALLRIINFGKFNSG